MEDEGYVEGPGGGFGGLLAGEHVEEVGSVGEGCVGFDDKLAFADAVEDGDQHGDLGGEVKALAEVGFRGGGFRVGVVDGEQGDGGAEDLHGAGVFGQGAEEVDDGGGEFAGGGELLGEGAELGGVGKFAVPEEIGGFFEGGSVGELVDVDAAVGEDALGAVDEADGGLVGDDVLEAFGGGGGGGHVFLQSAKYRREWLIMGVAEKRCHDGVAEYRTM